MFSKQNLIFLILKLFEISSIKLIKLKTGINFVISSSDLS